jgi:tetratricopeptide (TPR) repeat protein
MRRIVLLMLVLGLGWALPAWGQAQVADPVKDQDRARTESQARGQAAEADRLFQQGEFAAALPFYQAERASRAALGDLRYQAYAWRAIGCCQERLGDLDAAIDAWTAAAALDAERGDHGFEGYDLLLIGQTQLGRQQPDAARAALEKALPLLAAAGDRDHETDARRVLARALSDLGRPEDAPPHLERALELARGLNDPDRHADALAQLGAVLLDLDAPEQAAEWLSDARDACAEQGRTAEAAALDRLLGDAFVALGRPEVALARVEDASALHQQRDDLPGLADDLEFRAGLKAGAGDLPAARALARRAVTAWHGAEDPTGEIEARVRLAQLESLGPDGDWPASAATLEPAVALVLRSGQPADQVRLLVLAADVDVRAGNAARGRTRLDTARQIAEQADNGALRAIVARAQQRMAH